MSTRDVWADLRAAMEELRESVRRLEADEELDEPETGGFPGSEAFDEARDRDEQWHEFLAAHPELTGDGGDV